MPILPFEDKRPILGRRCFVAPTGMVIGDVEIGDESSVWFGAVLRGDVYPIRIGARVNIQDNSVVHVTTGRHATTIADDVTVGHRVILHGCDVGEGALVGMGAIVMDGAVIGPRSVVAAGSVVTEGTVVPEGVVVAGVPARPRRSLSLDEQQRMGALAERYVRLANRYLEASP